MTNDTCAPAASPSALRAIAISGWVLFGVWAIVLIAWAIIQPDPYAGGWMLVLELAFTGRAVNIAHGMRDGYSAAYLVFQSGLQDIILLLIAYPIIVAGTERISAWPILGRALTGVQKTAARQRRFVEPFGALGLWVFVFFPFWSTGALVGGVVGHLIGMRMPVVFASVFTGHAISVAALIWLFDWITATTAVFSEGVIQYLPWIVLAILLSIYLIMRVFMPGDGDDAE